MGKLFSKVKKDETRLFKHEIDIFKVIEIVEA